MTNKSKQANNKKGEIKICSDKNGHKVFFFSSKDGFTPTIRESSRDTSDFHTLCMACSPYTHVHFDWIILSWSSTPMITMVVCFFFIFHSHSNDMRYIHVYRNTFKLPACGTVKASSSQKWRQLWHFYLY